MTRLSTVVLVGLLSVCAGVYAADQPQDSYLLRVGDTISVTVWNHPEFSVPSVQIRPDGKFMHPYSGETVAAGRRPAELADQIREALLTELNRPMVSVTIVNYKKDWLFVTGAVRSPGAFPVREPLTIQQAVASAGGPTPTADLTVAIVITPEGQRREVPLEPELEGAQNSGKVRLNVGYTLVLGEREPQKVAVLGAVRKPGIYEAPPEGLRVSDAIALAGGYTVDADAQVARLTRAAQETITVDLKRIAQNVNDPANIALTNGDAILVPTRPPGAISVLGEVNTPGMKPLEPEKSTRISDAIALAGGLTRAADASDATLIRADGSKQDIAVDEVLKTGGGGQNLPLADGDTLIISSAALDVSVLGAVKAPNRYAMRKGNRFADAIAAAGGLTLTADRDQAKIIRPNGQTVEVDPSEAIGGTDPEDNPLLQDSDILVIDTAEITVVALGQVVRPGSYTLRPGARFSDAIAQAGGLPPLSKASTANLMRADGDSLDVDIDLALNRTDAAANVVLQDGDTIVVQAPPRMEVAVLGRVNRPQEVEVEQGDRISDVIAKAGGLAEGADTTTATLMRADGSVVDVDLEGILKRRDQQANLAVGAGDTLVVRAMVQGYAGAIGSVKQAGLFPTEQVATAADLLARAGGPTETADLKRAVLKRADGTQMPVDLGNILAEADTGAGPAIANGDMLHVPSLTVGEVALMGAVRSPGRHAIARDEQVSSVIARAGGLLPDVGIQSASLLHADGASEPVDILGVLGAPGGDSDLPLVDGDTLIITRADPITVVGAVKQPGVFPLPAGVKASAAIAKAQGPAQTADLEHASIMHKDGSRSTVDLRRVFTEGQRDADVELRPGDVLVIPDADYYVSVIGAVNRPGRYPFAPGARLAEAFALAGGLQQEVQITNCKILRGSSQIDVDVTQVSGDEQTGGNIDLQDGDTLIIGQIEPPGVSVLGRVQREGHYELQAGARLSQAIAYAGGFTPEADASRVRIVRDGVQQFVDMSPMLRNEDAVTDPALADGDLVVVPESSHRVTLLGVLKNPGSYHFQPGARVLDAVGQAGGWIEKQAAPNRTVFTRKVDDKIGWAQLNLYMGARGNEKGNPQLQDGDVIYIPHATESTSDKILKTLFPVASIIRLF